MLVWNKTFQYYNLYQKFQTYPIAGARQFPALWPLLKGFFIFLLVPHKLSHSTKRLDSTMIQS